MKIVTEVKPKELAGSVLITGFRGFGMVGYTTSKYMALSLKAKKVGYILTFPMPPFIAIEEDGIGYPYDIYYSGESRTTIIVNRALPEREDADSYTWELAKWIARTEFEYVILVGGLSKEFRRPDEAKGYRWIHNRYYSGPMPSAPQLESGLGVMGPLALLYMHLDYFRVPTIMILPYSAVEGADYEASLLAIRVISRELMKRDVSAQELEMMASMQKEDVEKILQMIERESQQEGRGLEGMFM